MLSQLDHILEKYTDLQEQMHSASLHTEVVAVSAIMLAIAKQHRSTALEKSANDSITLATHSIESAPAIDSEAPDVQHNDVRCSFCDRTHEKDGVTIVAGPMVLICNLCVTKYANMLQS